MIRFMLTPLKTTNSHTVPIYFYGDWPELELIELGARVAYCYDDPSSLEHRLCRANGLEYGSPPRHWKWDV
jgi:hypothetical protein